MYARETCVLVAGKAELRQYLQKFASKPSMQRLSDFHLLLYLAKQPNLDLSDMGTIIDHVHAKQPIPEGYTLIIDTIAEV